MSKMFSRSTILFVGLFAVTILAVMAALPAAAEPVASTMVHLPFVTTPEAVPTDSYETDFDDGIEPWKMVRWQKGGSYDLSYDSGCDSGHCGLLDLDVDNEDTYAIASPLILGPNRPYVIEFRAKLSDRQDKHQYGAVFGGDWDSGACPGDNTDSCFNHYYEFRVRYRDVNGDKYLEYRLRRIDGHDSNNVEQAKELVEWTRADGVNAEDWHKWSVRYGVRGTISFKVDNNELPESANDSKYADPSYFGLLARAGDHGDSRARITSFGIARDE
jgi:hypothetical protein